MEAAPKSDVTAWQYLNGFNLLSEQEVTQDNKHFDCQQNTTDIWLVRSLSNAFRPAN